MPGLYIAFPNDLDNNPLIMLIWKKVTLDIVNELLTVLPILVEAIVIHLLFRKIIQNNPFSEILALQKIFYLTCRKILEISSILLHHLEIPSVASCR